MVIEISISSRSTLFQSPVVAVTRHVDGCKIYLPGVCVIVNTVHPDISTHDVGVEPAAAAAISRLPQQDAT